MVDWWVFQLIDVSSATGNSPWGEGGGRDGERERERESSRLKTLILRIVMLEREREREGENSVSKTLTLKDSSVREREREVSNKGRKRKGDTERDWQINTLTVRPVLELNTVQSWGSHDCGLGHYETTFAALIKLFILGGHNEKHVCNIKLRLSHHPSWLCRDRAVPSETAWTLH